MSLMPPTIIRELQLKRHGYDVTPFGPYFQAFPDGRAITVYADDAQKCYDSIAQFSKRDADTLPKWEAWMKGVADVLGPLLLSVPPHVGSTQLGRPDPAAHRPRGRCASLGQRGVADVTRLFTMSVTDLLDDWFESDAIKAMLTVNGVIGTWAGPDEPGTAYVMLHHSIGDVGDGHLGSWGFQQGGMGAVSRLDPSKRRVVRRRGPHGRRRQEDPRAQRPRRRRGARGRRRAPRPGGRHDDPPEDRVPRPDRPRGAARRLRHGHRALEDPLGVGEGQRRDQSSCRTSSRDARHGAAGPPHRVRWSCALSPQYAERAFQDAHMERKAAVRPVRRRHDPDDARQEARARGRRTCSRCSPSGCPTTGTSSRTARSSTRTPSGSSTGTPSWRRTSRTRSSTTR